MAGGREGYGRHADDGHGASLGSVAAGGARESVVETVFKVRGIACIVDKTCRAGFGEEAGVEEFLCTLQGEVDGDGKFFEEGQRADTVEAKVFAVAASEETGAVDAVSDGVEGFGAGR